jgi:hypothetical protein
MPPSNCRLSTLVLKVERYGVGILLLVPRCFFDLVMFVMRHLIEKRQKRAVKGLNGV